MTEFDPASNRHRRALLQLGALLALAPAAFSAEGQVAMATAINRTARFRALSQRTAKAYCELFLDVDSAKEVMATAQGLIQIGFADLMRAGLSTAMAQQVANIKAEAKVLQAIIEQTPTQVLVLAASQQADKMLDVADATMEALQNEAKIPNSRLMTIAGRQRMLSQRLAKNYFLAAAGYDSDSLQLQMSRDGNDFVNALVALNASPLSTLLIQAELTLAEEQWGIFEMALQRDPDEKALRTVATTSERLLEIMNSITVRYEDVLKAMLRNA